jgi:hypothetical protein
VCDCHRRQFRAGVPSLAPQPPGKLRDVERHEAEALAVQIESETGLRTLVNDDGDGAFSVDIELPLLPGELRATATAHEPDDWPWLYDTRIRGRLAQPPSAD